MTFKDLKKLLNNSQALEQQQSKIFDRLRNKPFWIWDIEQHKKEDARTRLCYSLMCFWYFAFFSCCCWRWFLSL